MDLGSGITFDIFTHVLHGSFFVNFIIIYTKKEIHCDDLEDRYNVELKRKLYNSFYKMVKRIFI